MTEDLFNGFGDGAGDDITLGRDEAEPWRLEAITETTGGATIDIEEVDFFIEPYFELGAPQQRAFDEGAREEAGRRLGRCCVAADEPRECECSHVEPLRHRCRDRGGACERWEEAP